MVSADWRKRLTGGPLTSKVMTNTSPETVSEPVKARQVFRLGLMLFLLLWGAITLLPETTKRGSFGWIPDPCVFKAVFQLPCLTCGLTRGFISVLQGDLTRATQYHLLTAPLFIMGSITLFAGSFWTRQTLNVLNHLVNGWVLVGFLMVLIAAWGVKVAGPQIYW
ncbi:MAG: DUF2752 domain-containing protein [Vampirovibrio sp.]|nr:DUF2752 domain-containing protein [Vampirovibrio sp.]